LDQNPIPDVSRNRDRRNWNWGIGIEQHEVQIDDECLTDSVMDYNLHESSLLSASRLSTTLFELTTPL
jgi:hypothetical protein